MRTGMLALLAILSGTAAFGDYPQYQTRERSARSNRPRSFASQTAAVEPILAEPAWQDRDDRFAPVEHNVRPASGSDLFDDGGVQQAVEFIDPLVESEQRLVEQTGFEHPETASMLDDFPGELHLDDFGNYLSRKSVRTDIGKGVGYQDTFWSGNLFLPICNQENGYLVFSDTTVFVDNVGNGGLNLGGGGRVYSQSLNRVFGVYGFFDYDERNHNPYHQGSVGFDSLGDWLDFRGNLYLPNTEYRGVSARAFGLSNDLGRERALEGGDAEIGIVLPEAFNTQSRVYLGYYHFNAADEPRWEGWRVRVESYWSTNVMSDIQIYDDRDRGTFVVVGIGVFFQNAFRGIAGQSTILPTIRTMRRGKQLHITRGAYDRLGEPVSRLRRIATEKMLF